MLNTTKSEQPGGIQLFTSPQFGTIRTAGDAGNPLFCLTDVCKALGLTAKGVKQRLEDGVISNYPISDKYGRTQHVNFISEDGLYDVIFDSRKPEAKAFRKWVTSEVLPSIRKTGAYMTIPEAFAGQMKELIARTVAESLRANLPMPVPRSKSFTIAQVANELGTYPCRILELLVSIHYVSRLKGMVIPSRRIDAQKYFLNLPHDSYFAGGIVITELCRDEIISAFPTYKKQHPYM